MNANGSSIFINNFLYDIYLTRQILIPAAWLIWLIRELIGNPDGFSEFARYVRGSWLFFRIRIGLLRLSSIDCRRINGFSV
jgi:hypothetical protein